MYRLSICLLALLPLTVRAADEGVLPVGKDGRPLNLDFETGTLKDWTAVGDAFKDRLEHSKAELMKDPKLAPMIDVTPERSFVGLDAFEKVLGVRPALIRSGGTLPIVAALADKGIPTVITGFGLPDSQIHSPNERLVAEYVPLGTAAARELFLAYRDL